MAEPHVIVARTAISIPFQIDTEVIAVADWLARVGARRTPKRRPDKAPALVWTPVEARRRAPQLVELSDTIRAMFGVGDGVHGRGESSLTHAQGAVWLELSSELRQLLVGRAVLTHGKDGSPVARPAVDGVDLLVFPVGVGVLVFRLDWLPEQGRVLPADEVRRLLHVVRTIDAEDATPGWRLDGGEDVEERTPLDSRSEAHRAALGPAVSAALYEGATIGLKTLAGWLLQVGDAADDPGRGRLGPSRYAYHQTALVLDGAPDPEQADALLFHLRRGYDSRYVVPKESARDRVMMPRANRMVGVAREGVACISWLSPEASRAFEVEDWPKRFTRGIYLAIALWIHAQRRTQMRLEARAANQVTSVLALRHRPSGAESEAQVARLTDERDRLRSLAADLVHFSLLMTPDDSGGISEYDDFFEALRAVYGIAEAGVELRRNIQEVVALVETTYHEVQEIRQHREALSQERRFEEERRAREALVEAERRAREERAAVEERDRTALVARRKRERDEDQAERERLRALEEAAKSVAERRDRRVQFVVAALGAVTLPLAVVASVFGMEIPTRPNPDFWTILSYSGLASLVVVLIVSAALLAPVRVDRAKQGAAPEPERAPEPTQDDV